MLKKLKSFRLESVTWLNIVKIIAKAPINGTWQHLLLGFALTILDILIFSQIHTAIAVMVTLELVQWDILKYLNLPDTLHDLAMDAFGLAVGVTAMNVLNFDWRF